MFHIDSSFLSQIAYYKRFCTHKITQIPISKTKPRQIQHSSLGVKALKHTEYLVQCKYISVNGFPRFLR